MQCNTGYALKVLALHVKEPENIQNIITYVA